MTELTQPLPCIVCQTCGAHIGDAEIHIGWHKTLGHTGQHFRCTTCAAVRISAELGIEPNEPIPLEKKARFDELWNISRGINE